MPAAAGAAEILLEVPAPDPGAVAGIQTSEVALLANGIDTVAVDGRRAAEVAAGRTDLGRPDDLALVTVDSDDVGQPVLVAQRVDAIPGDGDAGVAGAKAGRLPDDRRTAFGPLLEQAGVRREVVLPGAAEARPVGLFLGSKSRAGEQGQGQTGGKQVGGSHGVGSLEDWNQAGSNRVSLPLGSPTGQGRPRSGFQPSA